MRQTRQRSKKKYFIIGGIAVVLIVISTFVTVVFHQNSLRTSADTPNYTTVLPKGKTISELGGWVRFTSPGTNNTVSAYNYNDSLHDVAISVTEQPLPSTFTGNVSTHVADFAKSFDATDTVKAGDTTIYIGTSSKGPQSVIFTKKGLLVLIKSEKKIENATWAQYVASLE